MFVVKNEVTMDLSTTGQFWPFQRSWTGIYLGFMNWAAEGAEVGGVQNKVGDKTERLGFQNCESTMILPPKMTSYCTWSRQYI